MPVETITLGCRLNFAESETLARTAPPGDWIIVNSCAVTNEAVRQSVREAQRQTLNEGLERHSDYLSARIVLAQVETELGEVRRALQVWREVIDLDPYLGLDDYAGVSMAQQFRQ